MFSINDVPRMLPLSRLTPQRQSQPFRRWPLGGIRIESIQARPDLRSSFLGRIQTSFCVELVRFTPRNVSPFDRMCGSTGVLSVSIPSKPDRIVCRTNDRGCASGRRYLPQCPIALCDQNTTDRPSGPKTGERAELGFRGNVPEVISVPEMGLVSSSDIDLTYNCRLAA